MGFQIPCAICASVHLNTILFLKIKTWVYLMGNGKWFFACSFGKSLASSRWCWIFILFAASCRINLRVGCFRVAEAVWKTISKLEVVRGRGGHWGGTWRIQLVHSYRATRNMSTGMRSCQQLQCTYSRCYATQNSNLPNLFFRFSFFFFFQISTPRTLILMCASKYCELNNIDICNA